MEGNVFWDANRNGVFDGGETGLTPVTVTLTGTDMFGNPVSRTTTTDASGHFAFLVPEGNYTLTYNTAQTTALGYPDATTATSYDLPRLPRRGLAADVRLRRGQLGQDRRPGVERRQRQRHTGPGRARASPA